MSEESQEEVGQQLASETAEELENNPSADTGCCTVRTKGWSQQYSGITEAACSRKGGPGFTTSWSKGDC
ncbi:MAG: hypothetical protein AB8B48_15030 [Pseudomonadales bacterium]